MVSGFPDLLIGNGELSIIEGFYQINVEDFISLVMLKRFEYGI